MSQNVTFKLLTDILINNKYEKRPPPKDYADMQGLLANYYFHGSITENVEINYEKALEWAQISNKRGSLIGKKILAHLYCDGLGVEKNIEKAIDYYKFLADKTHDLEALYFLGYTYYFEEQFKNIDKAIKWWDKTSRRNLPTNSFVSPSRELYLQGRANIYLGKIYKSGTEVPKDYKKASLYFYHAATENYDTEGFYLFGDMCYNEKATGIKTWNKKKHSHFFYLISAIAGDSVGQFWYGHYLYKELDDSYHAYIWLCLSAANSDSKNDTKVDKSIIGMRDTFEKQLTLEAISKAQEVAGKFKPIDMALIKRFFCQAFTKFKTTGPDTDIQIFFDYPKKFGYHDLPKKIYK